MILASQVQAEPAAPALIQLIDESVGPGPRIAATARVSIDSAAFSMNAGDEARVRVTGSVAHLAILDRYIRHPSGNQTWVGRVKGTGERHRIIVTRGPRGSFGLLTLPEGEYHLTTHAADDLRVTKANLDPSGPHGLYDDSVLPPASAPAVPAPTRESLEKSTQSTTIDLLILHTPTLLERYGAALQARLDHLVAVANQAYADSEIRIALRLVHVEQVGYSETVDSLTALQALAKSDNPGSTLVGDPSLAHVASLRRRYGADVVVLMRPYYRMHSPGSSRAYFAVRRSPTGGLQGLPTFAYSVVSEGPGVDDPHFRALESNLVHELGHNLGAHHNREHAGGSGVFPYSHGHGVPGLFATIMAHSYIQAPLEYRFSNPALSCAGAPCGIDETDTVNGANNALTLNNTRAVVGQFMPEGGVPAFDPITVVEYFHGAFGHYFITADPAEISDLDSGKFAGWQRTGRAFNGAAAPADGFVTVCRFFSTAFAPKSSHFYTALPAECTTVKMNRDWTFEGEVLWVLPVPESGACPAWALPVYRLYNDGRSGAPNHRYTIDSALRADMIANGWVAEGMGPSGVAFCAPL